MNHILWSNYLSVNTWCRLLYLEGLYSSVGIAARYVLSGGRSNPGGGDIFRALPNRH